MGRPGRRVTEIDDVNPYPAIFLGGFGMMAAYWLTRSMRASEPVVGVTPVTRPARTAALCAVAIVPFACGCLTLLGFLQLYPVGDAAVRAVQPVRADRRPGRADRRPVARRPAARGRAGPLGAVPRRRVRAVPGLFGWVSLVTILAMSHPDSAPVAVLRLFSPFAFFTLHGGLRRRHGLARVAVVLHRLAARPVRDRGPGGAAARGRGAGALPDHPCPRDRGQWRP